MTNTDPHASGVVDPDLEPGAVVGEYVIDGKLGQGGFGAVFSATHPLIGKRVAIKVLARRFSVDPEMVDRFQAEARAVNQIRHRNIIDIFSFGRLPDGRAYYAMEYLEGETLGDKIMRETRVPFETSLQILRAIARALDAAHAKGIAHRDLKPDNVFLVRDTDGGDDFPKLLDFGIAKLMRLEDGLKSKTQTGIPMGTPYYMSPEQCRGRDVDHRTDYYAFGVVAYEMLTGTFPIDGDDYMSILMKQMSEDAPPASSRQRDLPAGVDEVLAWLMRKDPAQRPPSLTAAVQALDVAAESIGIAVPRLRSAPIDVVRESRVLGAMLTPNGLSQTAPAGVPLASQTMPPAAVARASRRGVLIAAIVGGVVLGVGVFATLHGTSSHSDDADKPTPQLRDVMNEVAAHGPPTPPKPPSPPAPVADPGSAAVALVMFTIMDAPDGTEVHGPTGAFLGTVPQIELPRDDHDVVITFEADGFKPTSRTVHPTADATLSVKLEKKIVAATMPARPHPAPPPHPAPTAQGQNSIEDPFAPK